MINIKQRVSEPTLLLIYYTTIFFLVDLFLNFWSEIMVILYHNKAVICVVKAAMQYLATSPVSENLNASMEDGTFLRRTEAPLAGAGTLPNKYSNMTWSAAGRSGDSTRDMTLKPGWHEQGQYREFHQNFVPGHPEQYPWQVGTITIAFGNLPC